MDQSSQVGAAQNRIIPYILLLLLFACVLMLLVVRIGYRDISIGTDYSRYYAHYLDVSGNIAFEGRFEPGYQFLCVLGGFLGLSPEAFFTFVALLQLGLMGWAFREISTILSDSKAQRLTIIFVALIVLLLWPFTWNAVTNVIRHGLAVPFLLFGMVFLERRLYLRSVLAFTLAAGFHVSSFAFALSYICFVMFRKYGLIIVVLASLLYVFQLSDKIMMILESWTSIPFYTVATKYGIDVSYYTTGYRYDFFAFSLAPIVLIVLIKLLVRRQIAATAAINTLIRFYGTLLVPFLLLGYGAYMDRWLLPAWLFMPLFPALIVAFIGKRSPSIGLFSGVFLILTALLVLLVRPVPLL